MTRDNIRKTHGAVLLRIPFLRIPFIVALLASGLFVSLESVAGQEPARADVVSAMRRAAGYYRESVAVRGGYVYHYTLDLKTRWGEGLAGESLVWVQPPGTPTVGLACLQAFRATGDRYYLEAAAECARVLAFGQLRTGGWTNRIDVARFGQQSFEGGRRRRDSHSSLDDGQTQTALRCVMQVDEAIQFQDALIHEAAQLGLQSLLAAQFRNGAFPQVWTEPAKDRKASVDWPIVKASYPKYDWRTEGRIKNYWDHYTLNDNVSGYVVETLLDAQRIYRSDACLQAVRKLGDFFLLAQMPEPQPGWAQQYNGQMQPMWARKFEPPGVSGDETQEAIETLMRIHEVTGDAKYLAPLDRALDYLERSVLPDGQLARYYELRTNRPLYMQRNGKKYSLTYDDSRLPAHYGWKTKSRVAALRKQVADARAGRKPKQHTATAGQVRKVLSDLDDQSRWVTIHNGDRLVGQPKLRPGDKYLSSDVFSQNIGLLSDYIEAIANSAK